MFVHLDTFEISPPTLYNLQFPIDSTDRFQHFLGFNPSPQLPWAKEMTPAPRGKS